MKILYIVAGAIMTISGFISIVRPGFTLINMTWFLGAVLIFVGVSGIVSFFSRRKEEHMNIWFFIKPLLTTLVGGFVIFNPSLSDVMLGYVFGIWLGVTGVLQIVAAWTSKKHGEKGSVWSILCGILQIGIGIYAAVRPLVSVMAMGFMVGVAFVVYGVTLLVTALTMKRREDKEREGESGV